MQLAASRCIHRSLCGSRKYSSVTKGKNTTNSKELNNIAGK